jgi:hypothetical protein
MDGIESPRHLYHHTHSGINWDREAETIEEPGKSDQRKNDSRAIPAPVTNSLNLRIYTTSI